MSSMDDSSDRLTFHKIRSEQERERRRMRDRERRQSMTSEQRERHLARRRRNYQLRRQRVKHPELDLKSGSMNTSLVSDMTNFNLWRADGCDPESAVQFNYIAPVGSNQILLKVHAEHSSRSEGKEPLAYDLTKLQRRLRLIHVKHFARSLKRPLGELAVNNVPILADLIMKGSQVSCCKSAHGLRLSRLKQLARGQNCASKETSEQLPIIEAEGNPEEQNDLMVEGCHHPGTTDVSKTEVTLS